MPDNLKLTFSDDGKQKSASHTARVDFDGFTMGDFEAWGDSREEAASEMRVKLLGLRAAIDDLLNSAAFAQEIPDA